MASNSAARLPLAVFGPVGPLAVTVVFLLEEAVGAMMRTRSRGEASETKVDSSGGIDGGGGGGRVKMGE